MTSGAERGNNYLSNKSGSPDNREPEFICIGKIHRTHGIKGDVILDPMTDFPERIRKGKVVYIGEEHLKATVERVREKAPFLLVGFNEFKNETEAADFRNNYVYVRADELPKLPEGEYYFHELIGLEACDENGNVRGTLSDILETGANDVYVVALSEGGEELVPAIPQFIQKIDIANHRIVIDFPVWD